MPVGLIGAPSTFQRLIKSVFSGLIGTTLFSYLDDIIIFTKSVPEEIKKLDVVLTRLKEAGLKQKLIKCALLRKETTFLCHIINASGIHTSQDKITAMLSYPPPTKFSRSFRLLSSFYQRIRFHCLSTQLSPQKGFSFCIDCGTRASLHNSKARALICTCSRLS